MRKENRVVSLEDDHEHCLNGNFPLIKGDPK